MNFINALPPFNMQDLVGKKLGVLSQIDPTLANIEVTEGDLRGLDLSKPGILSQVIVNVLSRNQISDPLVIGEDWASKADIEV
jgi:hypothetical protein